MVGSVVAGALVCCLLVTGCGTPAVPPKIWARSVCTALAPWRSSVASLTQKAQQEISKAKTPEQTKQSLADLLAGAEAASDRARRGVSDAGVPDVAGGSKVAKTVVTALTKARDAYGHSKTAIRQLDPGEARSFYDAVEREFARLKTEYSASALDIDTVGPPPLTRAFDEVSECQ